MTRAHALGNAAFLNALLAIGLVAIYPIYQTPWFWVVAAVSLLTANLVAWLSRRAKWRWWLTALVTFGVYLVIGIPLASPQVFSAPQELLRVVTGVATAPVTGWKDILTLDLPLGTYQTTLALIIFAAITLGVVSLRLALSSTRMWVLAAPAALTLTVLGTVLGTSVNLGNFSIGGFHVSGVFQLVIGVFALIVALLWIVWRVQSERSIALGIARESSRAKLQTRTDRAKLARWSLSAAMLAIALVAGLAAAPAIVAGATRDVPRTSIDPELHLQRQLSPLETYRDYFSDDWFDTALFTVDAPAEADRVRIATLRYFDGTTIGAVSPTLGEESHETAFQRIPSPLIASASDRVTAQVNIQRYRGVWVPTVGSLSSIDFTGQDRIALADGFFYNRESGTGVQLASPGLVTGTQYTQLASLDDRADAQSFAPARSSASLAEGIVPEELTEWVELQQVSRDGAGLTELIDRLRERGYLSHALMQDEGESALWVQGLGGYSFEPSRAGHSTERIRQLFSDLLEREAEVGTEAAPEMLVAAVGNDEQFAVASMMLADTLGFDARIAIGAKLQPGDDARDGIPACEAGTCTGGNMAAWLEVQDAQTGAWAALDVTPQHSVPPMPDVEQRSDPRNQTEVDTERVDTVPPPEPNPSDSSGGDDESSETGLDLAWLWSALRIAGIVLLALLILAGPFLLIVIAKLLRRRTRFSAEDPVGRVVGGWNEFVDTAIDHGRPIPRAETRTEIARIYSPENPGPAHLAALADQAVFSLTSPDGAESGAYWGLVDEERRRLAREKPRFARIRAALSLRSFRHGFARARREANEWAQREKHFDTHDETSQKKRMNFRIARREQ